MWQMDNEQKASLDNGLFSSFRPISNPMFLAKAMEKVVASRLNCRLNDCDLYELFQPAYKQGHSTKMALLRVQNDILHGIDNNGCVIFLSHKYCEILIEVCYFATRLL